MCPLEKMLGRLPLAVKQCDTSVFVSVWEKLNRLWRYGQIATTWAVEYAP